VAQNQRPYAWRDYGNRVGLWNLLDLMDELAIPAAHNLNSAALEACPRSRQPSAPAATNSSAMAAPIPNVPTGCGRRMSGG
jgi:hypothetical protein